MLSEVPGQIAAQLIISCLLKLTPVFQWDAMFSSLPLPKLSVT